MSDVSVKTSKRQQEMMQFIQQYSSQHDYSPSYREIMTALGYKSVSTVAIHIDSLIAKGYVRKTNNSARSLEVITTNHHEFTTRPTNHEAWLKLIIKDHLAATEVDPNDVAVALKTLGLDQLKDLKGLTSQHTP